MSGSDSDVNRFWAETLNGLEHSERYHLSRTNCWKAVYTCTGLFPFAAVLGVVLLPSWFDLDSDLVEQSIEVTSSLVVLFGSLLSRDKVRKRMELHDSIRKDYLKERVKMEQGRSDTGSKKADLTSAALAEKARIEQREPDHLRVLQANCQNEIWVAHGCNEESDEYTKISFLQRRFMHLFDWRPHTLFSNQAKREAGMIVEEKAVSQGRSD